ncbi:MAG: hypothetical protein NC489_30780 [Ruminococcus flavefaciens]|nr:hypothetical protein [Ruminococcus flavefaciens]
MKQGTNFMEALYTEHFILNPRYAGLFDAHFIRNRELISHFDRGRTVKSACGQLIGALKGGQPDNKKLYSAYRLYFFLRGYLADRPYAECIRPEGWEREFLWSLRRSTNIICSSEKARREAAQELEAKARGLAAMREGIGSPCHDAAAAALDAGVMEILERSLAGSMAGPGK